MKKGTFTSSFHAYDIWHMAKSLLETVSMFKNAPKSMSLEAITYSVFLARRFKECNRNIELLVEMKIIFLFKVVAAEPLGSLITLKVQ